MSFKNATALALIGSLLITAVQAGYFINGLQDPWMMLGIKSYIFDLGYLIGSALLTMFFYALYQKQP